MSVIATLLPTTAHLQRLRNAVRDRHEILACCSWDEVDEACQRRPVRMVIADVLSEPVVAFDRVRRLKRLAPQLTVVAYSAVSAAQPHELFDAGREGVDGLIVANVDDSPRAFLAVIERSESNALTSALRKALEGVDQTVVDAVLLAVSHAHERLSPLRFAQLLALPRRSISQRLADAGFPSTQRLLTWGRLIVAAHMLEDPRRPADRVAASLAFPSGSAFRNVCQRYLHATPSDIRRRGGAGFVTRAMLRRVRGGSASLQTRSGARPGVAL
jgi:AraC-like DNA-binding protein